MLLNINPHNPQDRLVDKVVSIIQRGGVIAYPTDTYYGIGCDLMNKQAIERDRKMSIARKNLNWEEQLEYAIAPQKAKYYRETNPPKENDVCTMCGKYCAIKQVKAFFES